MKKVLYIFLGIIISTSQVTGQEENLKTSLKSKFGLKAGYSLLILRVTVDGGSGSEDVSGFYIGAFAEFDISEKFVIQPEIDYANYSQDGESSDVLLVSTLGKYKPNKELGLLFGPQLDYILSEDDSEGLKQLGIGLAIGASYDIMQNLIIDARYTFGLSNRLDDDIIDLGGFDVKSKFNYFQVGLGYRF